MTFGMKVTLAIMSVLTVGVASLIYDDYRLGRNFEQIDIGMSKKVVAEIAGSPRYILRHGETFPGGIQVEPVSCAEEYVYAPVAAPIIPYYPILCFEGSGRVTDKWVIASP